MDRFDIVACSAKGPYKGYTTQGFQELGEEKRLGFNIEYSQLSGCAQIKQLDGRDGDVTRADE